MNKLCEPNLPGRNRNCHAADSRCVEDPRAVRKPVAEPIETPRGTAIQTRWLNRHFRSRLEARWAVFFQNLQVHWQYEPEGFVLAGKPYLPDFFIPDWIAYFEIKPWLEVGRYVSLCQQARDLERASPYPNARAYVIFGEPDIIQAMTMIYDSTGQCIARYLDEEGVTNLCPVEGRAFDAYRIAMEERFERR